MSKPKVDKESLKRSMDQKKKILKSNKIVKK